MAKDFETILPKEAWITIDPDSLSAEQRQAWLESREAYKRAKEARERFEAIVRSTQAVGKHTLFSYRFGKLCMATIKASEAAKPAAKPAKKALSLAEYQAMQAAR